MKDCSWEGMFNENRERHRLDHEAFFGKVQNIELL